jgi:hypothetical protein
VRGWIQRSEGGVEPLLLPTANCFLNVENIPPTAVGPKLFSTVNFLLGKFKAVF